MISHQQDTDLAKDTSPVEIKSVYLFPYSLKAIIHFTHQSNYGHSKRSEWHSIINFLN